MTTAQRIEGETINAHEVYSLDEFKVRTRLGRHAFRQARNDGLKVIRIGGKTYVRGQSWLDYVAGKESTDIRKPEAATA